MILREPILSRPQTREWLGRVVRDAWVEYCHETGDDKPSHVAPWEELSEWEREADRRIGVAVVDALLWRMMEFEDVTGSAPAAGEEG